MPREARKKSETGIYHVMFRGINRQTIFQDKEDYQRFYDTLKRFQSQSEYIIYAYCLMSNHVHLLIREGTEELSVSFKRLGASYVSWYNLKYSRVGHLFQDRYRSEPVESDEYFLTALRYIHQNPLKARMVGALLDYPWSSYGEYLDKPTLCNTSFALGMFSDQGSRQKELFHRFNTADNNDKCLEYDSVPKMNDAQALDFIKSLLGVQDMHEIKKLNDEKRDELIRTCKNQGLSYRQIERLTGIPYGIIRRV